MRTVLPQTLLFVVAASMVHNGDSAAGIGRRASVATGGALGISEARAPRWGAGGGRAAGRRLAGRRHWRAVPAQAGELLCDLPRSRCKQYTPSELNTRL